MCSKASIPLGLCILLWSRCVFQVESTLLGGAFKVCSRSDPNLGQCIVDSVNAARPKLTEGIPELGLPPLGTVFADEIRMEEGTGDFNLRIVSINSTWKGVDDFLATRARVDTSTPYIEIETIIGPQNITGKYTFGGAVLTFRINGEGDFDMYFQGNVTHRIHLEEAKRDGEIFWRVKTYKYDMILTAFQCNYKNLFRGNQRLGSYANNFINRNWNVAFQVYKEIVNGGIGRFVKRTIIDKFFEKVPVRQLLSP